MRMSFLAFRTFLIFSAVNLSCAYDDMKTKLIGKWEFESVSTVLNEQFSHEPYSHQCLWKKDYLEFLENEVLKSFDHDTICNADILEGSWKLKKNKLTLTGAEIPTILYEIVALDSLKLKIIHHNPEYSIKLNLRQIN